MRTPSLAIVLVVMLVCTGCAPSSQDAAPAQTPSSSPAPATTPAPPPSATFKVVSLDIQPPDVFTGETVTVTAQVENEGNAAGIFTATLTVGGTNRETKELSIEPGASQTIGFSLVEDAPGTYEVGLGPLTSTLSVAAKPAPKVVELGYDDGQAAAFFAMAPEYGYLVEFVPPSTPFSVTTVRLLGAVDGTGWKDKTYTVEIWDSNYKSLHMETCSVADFADLNRQWVDVNLPRVPVSGKFFVHLFTGTGRMQGIHMGIDDSVVNEHSDATVSSNNAFQIAPQWPFKVGKWVDDKSKVNWMIRVVGVAG